FARLEPLEVPEEFIERPRLADHAEALGVLGDQRSGLRLQALIADEAVFLEQALDQRALFVERGRAGEGQAGDAGDLQYEVGVAAAVVDGALRRRGVRARGAANLGPTRRHDLEEDRGDEP